MSDWLQFLVDEQLSEKDAGKAPPVACGHLVLTYYNWPPLNDARWKKNIIDLIAETLGARPVLAWAKL